jgi:5'-3' exonuclease
MVANGLYFDTATMYYRAFFAVPDSVTAPDGTPSGAVRGFLDMAAAFISTYPAKQIAFAWDTDWRPNWRVNLIPSYKTHRLDEDSVTFGVEQIPDTLSPQISAISEILDAIGVARPGQIEFEADDILGTLVAKTKTNSYVVTGDRDLFQLVNDRAKNKVISMNKGMKNLEVVDDNYLLNKYGITGKQYAAFSTLRGDSSDGLPGVKGIGEKTASTLVAKYGSVEGVIRAAKRNDPALKASTKENILAATDYLANALEVVTVRTDAKLPKSLARPIKIKNHKELVFIANDWGLVKQVNRLLAALDLPKI